MTRFVDNFWTTEFTSTTGFDTIIKRLKDGRQTLKDFEDFLKQRAKVEEAYGKGLIRLSKSAGGKEEIGTMRKSWDEYINQTEKIGEAHMAMGQVLQDSIKKIHEFRELQRDKRKKIEETVSESQKQKKELYNKTTSLNKAYIKSCKDAEQAEDVANKSKMFANPKELDKLHAKKDKARQQAYAADGAYQKSVELLEETRQKWEKDFAQCCVITQALEEERIRFFRNELWVQTNIGSSYCSKDDHMYEDIRKVLEECDEDKDIEKFISQHKTGSNRPASIQYQNFYENKINSRAEISQSSIMHRNRQAVSVSRRPPEAIPVDNAQNFRATARSDGIQQISPARNISDLEFGEDPCYASVNDESNKRTVRALYDYTAQGAKELTFSEGDVITVIRSDDVNWWEGTCHGRTGMFPTNYIEDVTGNLTLL